MMFILIGTSLATTGGVPVVGTAEQIIGFPLIDGNVHSYRTDPNYFRLFPLIPSYPGYSAYGVWIYNNTNQNISAQVIGNLDVTGNLPDYAIGSLTTVNAGKAALLALAPYNSPTPYLGLQIQAAATPVVGTVKAVNVA
ncbi:MAG: hypothetical protein ACP5LG_08105, partial [Conexivisphaera sp.]